MRRKDAPPEGLPEYLEPIKCLGEGGMGSVWSVRDRRTDRVGALKAIRSGLLTEQAIVRRFEREMRTIAGLHHTYVVQILDVGRLHTGAPYMLMEQINGVPLIDLDLKGRTLGELIRLFDRMLAALGYAHARRIIHRDLKPDNVLVYTDELGELIPKLMDFGLAMVAVKGQLATRLTADGMVVGTPAYMAPEQACDEHHKICAATDLYAFGCMLFELLSGSPPHVAASPMALLLAHATKPPRPFVPLRSIPDAKKLEPLILRLLEKDPEARFEFAADVRKELRESGLLTSAEDVDTDQIGKYGDTIVAMPAVSKDILEAARVNDGQVSQAPSRPLNDVPELEKPSEAKFQVSVLNLREPDLVGRNYERNTLQRYVEDVRDAGQAAVCLVSGPTGIGKTRLVRWLAEDGETRGALRYLRVNVGAGSSAGLSVLLAIVNHLRLKGLTPSQSEQALLRFFRTTDPEDWRVSGFRALVERREGISSSNSSMNSTLSRVDLLLYAALERLADGRPLVLWLDETHGVKPQNVRKLVASIAARQKTQPTPMLVIVVDRADYDMPSDLELALGNLELAWLRSGIHLEPLTSGEMLELCHDELLLAFAFAQRVTELADGLPLLAVALARQWHAADLLESTPIGFVSRVEMNKLPVPEAVQGVLLNQLELAFRGEARELWEPVAQLAAVLGRTFTLAWLRNGIKHVPHRVRPIDAASFLELTQAEGLTRPNSDGTHEYVSGLMREGLLATLTPERMADLHRAAARAKGVDAGRQPGLYLEVAGHLLVGRSYDEAYEAFVSAAQDSFRHGRMDDAQQQLDAAQEALAQQDGVTGPWDTRVARVWELELEMSLERSRLSLAQERSAWIAHVAGRANDPTWAARSTRAAALVMAADGGEDQALTTLGDAILALRAAEMPDPTEAKERDRVLSLLLLEQIKLGEVGAIDEALALARSANDPGLQARALSADGARSLQAGDRRAARDRLTEALACATDVGDLRTEATALTLLADVSTEIEDHEQAEKLLFSACRCYEALGQLDRVAVCHRRLADLVRLMGRDDDARNHERWLKLIGG